MARERNEVIYSIRVEDIFLSAELYDREDDLTHEVIENVVLKIEVMDYRDMAERIDEMITDAVKEENEDE